MTEAQGSPIDNQQIQKSTIDSDVIEHSEKATWISGVTGPLLAISSCVLIWKCPDLSHNMRTMIAGLSIVAQSAILARKQLVLHDAGLSAKDYLGGVINSFKFNKTELTPRELQIIDNINPLYHSLYSLAGILGITVTAAFGSI